MSDTMPFPTPTDAPALAATDRLRKLLQQQIADARQGHPTSVEQFLADNPSLRDHPEILLDLIHNEAALRKERGEAPELAEYQQRFPMYAEALRIQWDVEAFLFSREPFEPQSLSLTDRGEAHRLGRYEVRAMLGQGGIGVAYMAWDPLLKRVVALKLLKAGGHANAQELARFRIEAEAIARVRHGNVVQVYDVGVVDGEPFIAMEYCAGGNLANRLKETPLAPREAARLLKQIAEGIDAVHQMHIVHRDLKPANIFLQSHEAKVPGSASLPTPSLTPTPADSDHAAKTPTTAEPRFIPRVSDFGLAKFLDTDDSQTRTGMILGTPAYMAPEQAIGKSSEVGPGADIYALGAILYECLTGQPPFRGATPAETLDQVRTQEPIPVRRLKPQVPIDLETIALQCLQKEPVRRYASANAVAEDLTRFLEGRPILARRVSQAERFRRWCGRNPVVASLTGVVFALLIVLASVLGIGNLRLTDALTKATTAEREARLREAEALVGEAHGIRLSRREGQRFAALAALRKAAEIGRELDQPADWFVRLRNEAIATLALPDMHFTRTWNASATGMVSVSVAADAGVYAFSDATGTVSIRRTGDDSEICRVPGDGFLGDPLLSPDGKFLGFIQHKAAKPLCYGAVWSIAAGPPVECFRESDAISVYFVDRQNGRTVLFSHPNGSVSVYDLAAKKKLSSLAPKGISYWPFLSPHPHEPLVAISSYHSRMVEIRDFQTGAVVAQETPDWPGGSAAHWHPSGQFLCICAGDAPRTRFYRFHAGTGRLELMRELPCGHGDTRLTFNRSGDRFFATGWGRTVSLWDFFTGQELFQTTTPVATQITKLGINSEANQLSLFTDPENSDNVGVCSVADAREYHTMVPIQKEGKVIGGNAGIHPDCRLAGQCFNDGYRLFDMATGAELGFTKHGDDLRRNSYLAFDGQGALYTNQFTGLFRWPVVADARDRSKLLVGPAQKLPFHPGNRGIAVSRDGRVVAQAMWAGYGMQAYRGGWILHPSADKPRHVDAGGSANHCTVSPDGRWAAFCSTAGESDPAYVYESATGKLVWKSPRGAGTCGFSDDGRWLLTGSSASLVYEVGTWAEAGNLGSGSFAACSGDVAAVATASGILRLVAVPSGRELARLEGPDRYTNAQFTGDGSRLVVVVYAVTGIGVWDLRRVRVELAKLGLDWDAPPYPPPAQERTDLISAEFRER